MKALRSETRTNGPEGLTTSEGDLEHPFKDREVPPPPTGYSGRFRPAEGKERKWSPGGHVQARRKNRRQKADGTDGW